MDRFEPLAIMLSRRRVAASLAGGAATLALAPLLGACGSSNDVGDSTATLASSGAGQQPEASAANGAGATGETTGGIGTATQASGRAPTYTYAPLTGVERDNLIVGVQALTASLDPARELGNVGTRISYTPYDTLIRRDFLNNNEHVPSLATAWERLSDTELELTLRDDVTFHNGDPFTANDVVFTFERMLNAGTDSDLNEARTYFSTFTRVTRVDDYTVRIETAAPDPLLIKRLASWASWIVPKAYIESVGVEEFMRTGMGTGPYAFVSFEPDNELVMERYDGYWDDKPPAKQITFRVIPEVAARVTALINDEVQIITNIPPDQAAVLEGESTVGLREIALANVHVLSYNTNHPALADKKLRQALNLGIDRQLIIDTIWNGKAEPKRGHQFPEYGPLYNPDRPLTPYDPEQAKTLLAESRYDGGELEYQLQAGYYTNGEQVGEAIVAMWQEIGINAVIRVNDDSTTGKERQVHTWSNSSRLADPDGSIWVLWGTESGVQKNYWTAPAEFNRLGEEARATLDEKLRYDNYQQLLDIWEDEAPGTVLYDPHEFYGVSNAVNWSPYSFYYMDLRAYNLSFNEA